MSEGDSGSDTRGLHVVSSRGETSQFLRGMITHDLVKRGVDFDEAYAMARRIRARVENRDRVTTAELRELIDAELAELYRGDPARLAALATPATDLSVRYEGRVQPFSKGVLARSIYAAGVDLDRAYRLVGRLEAELRSEGVAIIESVELTRRVDEILERDVGAEAAGRYRLVRRIRRLPRPLIVYLGGASGTGKSSLALELAPLLRIYRVIASDTVRQVMRTVFTPTFLPELHSSSFELPGRPDLDAEDALVAAHDLDYRARLLASYEEQSTRVIVGVRAVVERAIAENESVIVEGAHLHPALLPFPDLEGSAYQVPLLLGALDVEAHRARFLRRSRGGARGAERYLDAFEAIRIINDHLLEQAEATDTAMLDSGEGDELVSHALNVITDALGRRIRSLSRPEPASPRVPVLVVMIDGLADQPTHALGGRTPLQAANTPVLDRLAREGAVGIADSVGPGIVPDTAAGTLALFSQSPNAMRRGPVEALGTGLPLLPGDVALRGNLATVDEHGSLIDRRAGRIREGAAELAAELDRIELPEHPEVTLRVAPATEHRVAVVLRGQGLSPAISGSDPGAAALPCPPLIPAARDPGNGRAVHTARVLATFESAAAELLEAHPINRERAKSGRHPANRVITRGAGRVHGLAPLEDAGLPLRVACISGDHSVLGIARWLGATTITSPAMTANLDTDLDAKFAAAREALGAHDLVVIHVKAADVAAHDRRADRKARVIEDIDAGLGKLLEGFAPGTLRVAVASDHATLSESGQHAADPLPVLLWGPGIEADLVESFDEHSAATGSMGRFPLQRLLGNLYQLA